MPPALRRAGPTLLTRRPPRRRSQPARPDRGTQKTRREPNEQKNTGPVPHDRPTPTPTSAPTPTAPASGTCSRPNRTCPRMSPRLSRTTRPQWSPRPRSTRRPTPGRLPGTAGRRSTSTRRRRSRRPPWPSPPGFHVAVGATTSALLLPTRRRSPTSRAASGEHESGRTRPLPRHVGRAGSGRQAKVRLRGTRAGRGQPRCRSSTSVPNPVTESRRYRGQVTATNAACRRRREVGPPSPER